MLQTLADTAVLGADWLRMERPRARRIHREQAGKHLALLAWALPPTSSAGVYRPLSFMQYGCRLGWRIDAFCSEAPHTLREHGEELLARVPREATLHVVPPSSREPSYRFFPRVDGGFANALAYARHAIGTMSSDPPDVVMASGPPFFTFVAARLVARHFGVPLVLDYRDEWTQCPFDFVDKGPHDRALESRCLRSADAVFFTTESHRRHQLAAFPELDPRKTHLVPNGWEPSDFVEPEREPREPVLADVRTVRIAHVGNLPGHTAPGDFLDSLEMLLANEPEWRPRVHAQFVGRRATSSDRALRSFKFPELIEVVDHVGKREANRRMQESDVLLLLSRPDLERYLPGKLFDYLAARRPVLVFGSNGESSALINRLGAGVLCSPGSGSALKDALLRLRRLDLAESAASVHAWLQEHRRDSLAARAFGIIDTLREARATASA